MVQHIENYINKETKIQGHNLDKVLQFIERNIETITVNTRVITGSKAKHGESHLLELDIGELDGYRKMRLKIDYQSNFDVFYLHVDYLLKKYTYTCKNVDELLVKLEECKDILYQGK